MAEKSVIIIGAGVAGLSTGCYARMNGYRTHIFEQHNLPGLSAHVEMTDVATPCTLERYTRNHRASFEGWMPDVRRFGAGISRTLPGLDHFYRAGQWVEVGGGIPPAVAHGNHIAQILCRRDGKRFQTSRP
jgi:phytoene dehydrogenase-like protein